MGLLKSLKNRYRRYRNAWLVRDKAKFFCIGRNKTGTTSLEREFRALGFIVGRQRTAEILCDECYARREFGPIIEYCQSAEVFQDVPFSLPDTFRHMDKAFPGSKFILTVRDDPEQWYQSLIRFQSRMFGRNGTLPTADDLRNATYVRRGWAYNRVRTYGTSDDDIYNRERLIAHYVRHNNDVMKYFADRRGDLLVINLAQPDAYARFLEFVGAHSERSGFPWENRG